MKHDTIIADDVLKQFANQVGNLRYDLLCDFIRHLSQKLHCDAIDDLSGGRKKLYQKLVNASMSLDTIADEIAEAWELCESKMPTGFEHYDDDLAKVFDPKRCCGSTWEGLARAVKGKCECKCGCHV